MMEWAPPGGVKIRFNFSLLSTLPKSVFQALRSLSMALYVIIISISIALYVTVSHSGMKQQREKYLPGFPFPWLCQGVRVGHNAIKHQDPA